MLDQWMAEIAARVEATAVSRILDLACGTGRFAPSLAARFDATVVGVAPSMKMIRQARDRCAFDALTATRGQSRIQIDARTRTKLPLPIFRSVTLSSEHRHRWYRHDEQEVGLFTRRGGTTGLSFDIGVGKRWNVGRYAEFADVTVAVKGRRDQRFSVVNVGAQLQVPLFWNGRFVE